jgi:hypothetical protein
MSGRVTRIDRPKDRTQTNVSSDLGNAPTIFAVRGTNKTYAACRRANRLICPLQFLPNLDLPELNRVRVGVRVVADLMTFGDDPPKEPFVAANLVANHEESCSGVVSGKKVKQRRRVVRRRAVVECERDCRSSIARSREDEIRLTFTKGKDRFEKTVEHFSNSYVKASGR